MNLLYRLGNIVAIGIGINDGNCDRAFHRRLEIMARKTTINLRSLNYVDFQALVNDSF